MSTCHRHEKNHAIIDMKNISRHISHVIPIKWYSKYPRNSKIMSIFSRDTTVLTLCRASFKILLQCTLLSTFYFQVCRLILVLSLCYELWNSQSPHLKVDYVKLTIYHSAMDQRTIFVQSFKSYYTFLCVDMSSTWQDRVFTDKST